VTDIEGDKLMSTKTGIRAKRGELIVVPVTLSYTYLHGGTHESSYYLVQRITSVRRDGTAQARESLITGMPSRGVVVGQLVVKDIDVERASRAIVERGSDEFESLEAVREFLRPFKVAADS